MTVKIFWKPNYKNRRKEPNIAANDLEDPVQSNLSQTTQIFFIYIANLKLIELALHPAA